MGRFLLMRHGEADFLLARERRLQGGCIDWVPLTAQGVQDVECAAAGLREAGVEVIVSSPMTRAVQTAAIVSRVLGVPMQVEFDLHEWMPDRTFRFSTYEEVCAASRERDACGGEWPAGSEREWEPLSRVRERVVRVLERYRGQHGVLAVCHQVVIEVLVGQSVSTAGVTECDWGTMCM